MVLALAGSILLGYSHYDNYFLGSDMRNRIVGARALLEGINPYDQQALVATGQNGVPRADLADMLSAKVGISAITANPLALRFYQIYCDGPWPQVRGFWFIMEWLAMLTAILLAVQVFARQGTARLTLLVSCVCFVFMYSWLQHVKFGQMYIFAILLLCLDMWLLSRCRRCRAWAGIATGFAVAFRPMVLIIVPALWLAGERRAALLAATSALLLLGTSLVTEPQLWRSYSSVAQQWIDGKDEPITPPYARSLVGTYEVLAQDGYHVPRTKSFQTYKNCADMSVCAGRLVLKRSLFAGHSRLKILVVSFAGAMVLAGLALYWRRQGRGLAVPMLLALALPVTEFATPVKQEYNQVMSLAIIVWMIATILRNRLTLPAIGFFLALPFLCATAWWSSTFYSPIFMTMIILLLALLTYCAEALRTSVTAVSGSSVPAS